MKTERTIKKIITGEETSDGAGVKLTRVFSHDDTRDFDPFLLLDAFDSTNPDDYIRGFPWHPHRGIETITYIIQGRVDHGDSLGNRGRIQNGSCQWMTAGSGIIHQEMPKPSKHLLGVQLWLNLAAKDKMTAPQYRDIRPGDVPVVEEGHSRVHILCGAYKNTPGAMTADYVKATYLDVQIQAGKEWSLETAGSETLFVYILEGAGRFESKSQKFIVAKQAILFNSGQKFFAAAGDSGLRFLLLAGKPLKEPIAWGGPIVMNTEAELEKAFRELDAGTFVTQPK
jgi:redox-sensitive bicupin YhaK (pirin superfamily)